MTTPAKKKPATKHKSKGKQHPLHAESLDRLANACQNLAFFGLARAFEAEAKRVRGILR